MNMWKSIVSYWYYIWTPAPPSLEEARARLAAAKPIVYTDEQIAAFERAENENFGPMCGCTPRKWWQRWL